MADQPIYLHFARCPRCELMGLVYYRKSRRLCCLRRFQSIIPHRGHQATANREQADAICAAITETSGLTSLDGLAQELLGRVGERSQYCGHRAISAPLTPPPAPP